MTGCDLSTTRAAGDPVAGCECSCDRGWQDVQDEVNRALDSPDPLERNRRITQAYDDLAKADPRNVWVRLASYVSVQGGCAMALVQTPPGLFPSSEFMGNMSAALDALADANSTIFSSIYPVARFVQKCGAAQLQKCVESGAFQVDPELLRAMKLMEAGQLKEAADIIAKYEQIEVVQPVYEQHAAAFDFLMGVQERAPLDLTSIAISKECTRHPDQLVKLDGLDIRNPIHRVDYYGRLLDRMLGR